MRGKIKNFLKRFLPMPTKTLDYKLSKIISFFEDENKKINENISNAAREEKEHTESIITAMADEKKRVEEMKTILLAQVARIENITNLLADQKINTKTIINNENEILWAEIFNNTIENSSWLLDKSLSPGRWAVGYQYLYVMYRVLNEVKPKKILELGLGQSTRVISQYVKSQNNIKHYVVEHDIEWEEFFKKSFTLPNQTELIRLPLVEESLYSDDKVICYGDFKETFKEKKFDFISIDGPFGGKAQIYSRIDVLKILPDCLDSSFVILLDDYNRSGEQKTAELMENLLREKEILFSTGKYWGQKATYVLASKDLEFLCSL